MNEKMSWSREKCFSLDCKTKFFVPTAHAADSLTADRGYFGAFKTFTPTISSGGSARRGLEMMSLGTVFEPIKIELKNFRLYISANKLRWTLQYVVLNNNK